MLSGCAVTPSTESERPLRVGILGRPSTVDPHLQDDGISHSVLFHVFEGLTAFDGNLRVIPALAASWDNPDDLTWRFRLREASFHDGRPLEAEDVVASLERARVHPSSLVAGYLATVASIRALDRTTVEIRTTAPSAILLNKLAFVAILPRDAGAMLGMPIGTGPYRLTSPIGERMPLHRFDSWWQSLPAIETVEMVALPDANARLEAMRQGDIDLNMALPSRDLAAARALPGWRVSTRSGPMVSYLGLRVDRPPFDDPRVRRALALGIDRTRLLTAMHHGQGQVISQIAGPHVFGHDPGMSIHARDLTAARALLEEALGATPFEVEIEVRDGLDVTELIAQLEELGVRARQRSMPWPQLLDRLQQGLSPAWVGGLLAPSGDASDILDGEFHSRGAAGGFGSANATGLADEELDALIRSSGGLLDPTARRRALQAAVRRIAELAPVVPLYVPDRAYAAREELIWSPRADGFLRAAEAAWR
jgi:peptide/nickel transport system substrate-binding protein